MKTPIQKTTVTTPFGQNVGYNIIDNLKLANLFNRIDIKTIKTRVDRVNKQKITALEYVFKS